MTDEPAPNFRKLVAIKLGIDRALARRDQKLLANSLLVHCVEKCLPARGEELYVKLADRIIKGPRYFKADYLKLLSSWLDIDPNKLRGIINESWLEDRPARDHFIETPEESITPAVDKSSGIIQISADWRDIRDHPECH